MAMLAYIQISRKCNQNCVFCSSPSNGKMMDAEKAKESVNEFVKEKQDGIIWTGGEPTLHEQLPEFIRYACEKGIRSSMVTNGQKIADIEYFKTLIDAGLEQLHLSLFSYKPKVQAFLSRKEDSYENIIKTIENAEKLNFPISINTVINKYNSDHLSETIKFIITNYPHIRHFVWNNIDALMIPKDEPVKSVARLNDFELELYKAMKMIDDSGRSFRVERVPLCYMADYAQFSTEARKIVKEEKRCINFLDEKEKIKQTEWQYDKADCCSVCTYNEICAGLWQMDVDYFSEELYPVFLDPEDVRKKILE